MSIPRAPLTLSVAQTQTVQVGRQLCVPAIRITQRPLTDTTVGSYAQFGIAILGLLTS